jgi:hypothetical protein
MASKRRDAIVAGAAAVGAAVWGSSSQRQTWPQT